MSPLHFQLHRPINPESDERNQAVSRQTQCVIHKRPVSRGHITDLLHMLSSRRDDASLPPHIRPRFLVSHRSSLRACIHCGLDLPMNRSDARFER